MSKATNQLQDLLTDLMARYEAVPQVAKRTSYANHLAAMIQSTAKAVEESEKMDQEKRDSRNR